MSRKTKLIGVISILLVASLTIYLPKLLDASPESEYETIKLHYGKFKPVQILYAKFKEVKPSPYMPSPGESTPYREIEAQIIVKYPGREETVQVSLNHPWLIALAMLEDGQLYCTETKPIQCQVIVNNLEDKPAFRGAVQQSQP